MQNSSNIGKTLDPVPWAKHLRVSVEACQLALDADLIDLHLDTELPRRLFGYNPMRKHAHYWPSGNPYFGQADAPRLMESGFTGVVWDHATNVFRAPKKRLEATLKNIQRSLDLVRENSDVLALVRSVSEYAEAKKAGKLALWMSVQGGNAFEYDFGALDRIPQGAIVRVTLVHLTNSTFGATNSPLRMGSEAGLSVQGKDFVGALQARKILVDLAHIHPSGFWDAIQVADPKWPIIASHTGVNGVYRYWRNLDDEQILAIAKTGGVVGIIYHTHFLKKGWKRCSVDVVLDHIAHVVQVAGEDHAALGSDYDGLIIPPSDLRDPTYHPCLIQKMLDRKWSEMRIRKILGLNWLRTLAMVRP